MRVCVVSGVRLFFLPFAGRGGGGGGGAGGLWGGGVGGWGDGGWRCGGGVPPAAEEAGGVVAVAAVVAAAEHRFIRGAQEYGCRLVGWAQQRNTLQSNAFKVSFIVWCPLRQ